MVACLCHQLPAAACIDGATCVKVLLRAFELKQLDPVEALLGLPAADEMPATALGELLAAAIRANFASIALNLCDLPGAEELQHETLVELIIAAEEAWKGGFSREKPDRTLWGLEDLKSIAYHEM